MSSHCDMAHPLQTHGGGKGRGVVDARQNAEVFTLGGVSFITAGHENDRRTRSSGGEFRSELFGCSALPVRARNFAVIRADVVLALSLIHIFSYDILYGADVVRRELGCRIAG